MVDWKSPSVIAQTAIAENNSVHALVGLWFWEFFISMDFDWMIFTGKRKFRWPLIFYFLGRYGLSALLIAVVVALNVKTKINCQGLYTFNQFMGGGLFGIASINLAIRTMALYRNDRWVVGGLVLLIIGHWVTIFHGLQIKAAYIPGEGCEITNLAINSRQLSILVIYGMCLDFVILILTAYKLGFRLEGRGYIIRVMFKGGLIYFIASFIANLIAVIFGELGLNPIMGIIFDNPAVIVCTIAASRAVRNLSDLSDPVSDHSHYSSGSRPLPPRAGQSLPVLGSGLASIPQSPRKPVQIQMDTYRMTDDDSYIPSKYHQAGEHDPCEQV